MAANVLFDASVSVRIEWHHRRGANHVSINILQKIPVEIFCIFFHCFVYSVSYESARKFIFSLDNSITMLPNLLLSNVVDNYLC